MTFNRFLFADYSGGGEHDSMQAGIALADFALGRQPSQTTEWSRARLYEHVRDLLVASSERILFGFDHQYSWPVAMMRHAGFEGFSWDEFLAWLAAGDTASGRPALDIPQRYAPLMNAHLATNLRAPLFYAALSNYARRLGLPDNRPAWAQVASGALRATERASFPSGRSPTSACALGGQGPGSVGGQTLCGLNFLHRLRTDAGLSPRLAFWPFDGLDIGSSAYEGKHVAVEIYPAGIAPKGHRKSDPNDAGAGVRILQAIGTDEELLVQWLTARAIPAENHQLALLEGWILGAGKNALPASLRVAASRIVWQTTRPRPVGARPRTAAGAANARVQAAAEDLFAALVRLLQAGDPHVVSYSWAYRTLSERDWRGQSHTAQVVRWARATRPRALDGLGTVQLDTFIVASRGRTPREPSDQHFEARGYNREQWQSVLGRARVLHHPDDLLRTPRG